MSRDTTIIKLASSFGENLVHVIVGLFFMAGGAWLVWYGVHHPDTVVVNGVTTQQFSKWFLGGGASIALLGALFMPTILPMFKQIVVVVSPYIPVVGGRRAGDQQPKEVG
jgi:hypothetical protein